MPWRRLAAAAILSLPGIALAYGLFAPVIGWLPAMLVGMGANFAVGFAVGRWRW